MSDNFICPECDKTNLVCSGNICDDKGNVIEVFYAYCFSCFYRTENCMSVSELEEVVAEDRLNAIERLELLELMND